RGDRAQSPGENGFDFRVGSHKKLLPTFVAGATESLQPNVVAREMTKRAPFVTLRTGEHLVGSATSLGMPATSFRNTSRSKGGPAAAGGASEDIETPSRWPPGYDCLGLRSPSAACGRTR